MDSNRGPSRILKTGLPRFSSLFSPRGLLFLVLLLALFVRGWFLIRNWDNLEMAQSFLVHAEVARNVLNGSWLQVNTSYLAEYAKACLSKQKLIDPEDFPPPTNESLVPLYNDEGGYGTFLAALWKLTGSRRWWHIRVLQMFIDVLMCWLVYRIGDKLVGWRVGILAAVFYALFLPGVEMAVRPHRDIWVTFLFIGSVFLMLEGVEKRSLLRFAAISAATGFVTLMRSTVVLYVFFLGGLLFIVTDKKTGFRFSMLMVLVFGLTVFPLVVRNYNVFGKFLITRGAFWHAFWGGVGQFPNSYKLYEDDQSVASFADKLSPGVPYGTEEYEGVLREKALQEIPKDPLFFGSVAMRRGLVMLFPTLGRMVLCQQQPYKASGFLYSHVSVAALVVLDTVLVSLALYGMWISRRNWKNALIVVTPMLYTIITLAPLSFQGRNIKNFYFVELLFASVAIFNLWDRFRQQRNSRLLS